MVQQIGMIGFGEAGSTFALAGGWGVAASVFDIKAQCSRDRADMLAAYSRAGVLPAGSLEDALASASIVLSIVTAGQALAVAEAAAASLLPGALYCDLNSVAPQTKAAAARLIEASGAHYVDVAVMAPVLPARLAAPLLLSGPMAAVAAERLGEMGFVNLRVVGDAVGGASSIKMIRSVMVKGLEALTAECVLAAEAAGVRDEVLASLDASEKTASWSERADYNLDRMLVHGLRRAAEMEEVAKTIEGFGLSADMARATAKRQRSIGCLALAPVPEGLGAKLDILLSSHSLDNNCTGRADAA